MNSSKSSNYIAKDDERIEHPFTAVKSTVLYIRVQRLLGHANLKLATRYVQTLEPFLGGWRKSAFLSFFVRPWEEGESAFYRDSTALRGDIRRVLSEGGSLFYFFRVLDRFFDDNRYQLKKHIFSSLRNILPNLFY